MKNQTLVLNQQEANYLYLQLASRILQLEEIINNNKNGIFNKEKWKLEKIALENILNPNSFSIFKNFSSFPFGSTDLISALDKKANVAPVRGTTPSPITIINQSSKFPNL